MRILLDIDGTICSETLPGKYDEAEPYVDVIEYINKLYTDGHYIMYFTARGMGANNGAAGKAYNRWYSITEAQLKRWGVKYDELLLGKPHADIYIDDKALRVNRNGKGSLDIIKEVLDGN